MRIFVAHGRSDAPTIGRKSFKGSESGASQREHTYMHGTFDVTDEST